MIIPKLLINTIATQMVKHFKLDKIMSYVFDKNELDTKVEELERRIKVLENLKCNYNKEENNG
tara:strand:+ start:47 stop:235 length:189 start_codon:yes stop_codon:yes gene_type:complete